MTDVTEAYNNWGDLVESKKYEKNDKFCLLMPNFYVDYLILIKSIQDFLILADWMW